MISKSLTDQLLAQAEDADRLLNWPDLSWQALEATGAFRWSIPCGYGGDGSDPVVILRGTEEIAARCLTTAFILSQREAGVRQLLKGPNPLQERFLPQLAAGQIFLTVGLSQLSTSRQHLGPSLRATPLSSGKYQLDGMIPWVTGADAAAIIVVGATLPDSAQILCLLESGQSGVRIESPMDLSALKGSRTSLVHCSEVMIPAEMLVAGPAESVLGKGGGGGLETSCLGIGLSRAAVEFIEQESKSRPELAGIARNLEAALHVARKQLHFLARSNSPEMSEILALRVKSTTLALRSTQAALMIAKGGGFVVPHPVQRWARQALFFLVWSCPRAVAEGVLASLATGLQDV